MVRLTRTEVNWIIWELNKAVVENRRAITPEAGSAEKALFQLRADNLSCVAGKLQTALDIDAKSISIE